MRKINFKKQKSCEKRKEGRVEKGKDEEKKKFHFSFSLCTFGSLLLCDFGEILFHCVVWIKWLLQQVIYLFDLFAMFEEGKKERGSSFAFQHDF